MTDRLAYSPAQAAIVLGLARSTFYDLVLPELRVVRVGRRVLVPRSELERWLKNNAGVLSRGDAAGTIAPDGAQMGIAPAPFPTSDAP